MVRGPFRAESRVRVLGAAALLAIVVASALLALTGLGTRHLWEDEAENALLAKSILAVGLPIARDGKHVISQGCGSDADRNYLWTFHPWLPMYLTAGAFELLGVSTVAARLPFALLAVLCVPSLYVVGRRLFADRATALLAAGVLGLSVPFLLHARQSRYYAVAAFGAIWLLYFFRLTVEGARWGPIGLVVASTVMFHSNHPMFVAMFAGLVVAFGVLEFERRALVRIVAAGAATVALNAPWLLIYGDAWMGAAFGSGRSPGLWLEIWHGAGKFAWYLGQLDLYVFPAVLLVGFLVWAVTWGRAHVTSSAGLRAAVSLAIVSAVYVACVAAMPYVFFRYLVNLLPALALLQAWMLRTLGVRRPAVAGALVVLLVGTDALYGWTTEAKWAGPHPRIASALWSYADEITHEFHGPVAALVGLLRTSARPGDRVFISYGDLPLRFYTDLDVRGGEGCDTAVGTPPDWIVVRHFFRFRRRAPGVNEDMARVRRFLDESIPWDRYERIELPVVDTVWENIPEPRFHFFRAPAVGPRLVVHRLRKAGAAAPTPPPSGAGGGGQPR